MKKNQSVVIFAAFILILFVAAGCAPAAETPTPGSQPVTVPPAVPAQKLAPVILPTSQAVPPVVTAFRPGMDQEASLNQTVEVDFDRPMDQKKTEAAWQMSGMDGKLLAGRFSWTGETTLRFTPDQKLASGNDYEITISTGAVGKDGVAFESPFTFQIHTLARLEVGQVFPANDSNTVQPSSQITVLFNRPVVELRVDEEQDQLVQPLTFDPPLSGKGEWINSSVYVFQPDPPLRTATRYQASIAAGLQDVTALPDAAMENRYSWQFTTLSPQVLQMQIENNTVLPQEPYIPTNVSTLPKITIDFGQPMNPASFARGLSMTGPEPQLIPLRFQWAAGNQQITITPLRYLRLGEQYTINLQGLEAADGGVMETLQQIFDTIPSPAVVYAGPPNGDLSAGDPVFALRFASPMSQKSFGNRITFSPPLPDSRYYYDEYENALYYYGLQPSTRYEVRVQPGMFDIHGNAINTPTTVSFSTAPLESSAYLDMPYTALYRDNIPQEFYVRYTNINSAEFWLYRVSLQQYINFQYRGFDLIQFDPAEADLVWHEQIKSAAGLNVQTIEPVSMSAKDGGKLPGGIYALVMKSPDVKYTGKYLDGRILMVSSANMTFKQSSANALVWLTDLASGKPLANVALKVIDDQNKSVTSGKTDRDGLFAFDFSPALDGSSRTFYAITDDARHFAISSSGWYSGVSPEDFGLWSQYYGENSQTAVYLYTDRPLYRPGQPVYFKGIVRNDRDMTYQIPTEKTVDVTILNYDGEEVYQEQLSLSGYGSFNGQFELDTNAALGSYFIQVKMPDSDSLIGSLSFTVAEYRKPEFILDVGAQPAEVLLGEEFETSLTASYYSGGALSNAQVNWSLRSDPDQFFLQGKFSDYSFYDDSDSLDSEKQVAQRRSRIVTEGSGVTDANGQLSLTLPADLQATDPTRRLVLDVTVSDLAGTSVSGQALVTAHRSLVYAGLKPAQYVGKAGEAQTFDLVTVDWQGKPQAGQKMQVTISERQWFSVQEEDAQGVLRWVTTAKDTPVVSLNDLISGEDGLAQARFTPEKGGVYRARVVSTDANGKQSSATAYLWVSGSEYIPWQRSNDRTFQLVVDRDSYNPGDQAEILIASPYQGTSYALVTVERGLIRKQEVIQLSGNSTIYRLPVSADMAPVVYVSVMVVKGVDDTNPRPDFRIGMASLNVSTEKQKLNVALIPDRKEASPGEEVVYTVKVSDTDGKPVQAEVSLGLSDLAVLSLMDSNSQPILDYFYNQRGLAVRTSVPIVFSIEDYNSMIQAALASGAAAGSGGGGKGFEVPGVPGVRQNFPDTAFWRADVTTDEKGQALVSVTLPDNLTTWRMDARAVTQDTRVGQTTVDLVSSKPLLVRPQTPRFFVAGDQAVLGTAVHNNTGKDLTVSVVLEGSGIQIDGQVAQSVLISNGQQAYITWNVTIPDDAQRVDVVFSASGGDYQDASRPTLGSLDNQGIPVYRYQALETVSTAGELTGAGTRTEAIMLPKTMKVDRGQLDILIEPSLAAGMQAGLTYLEHYPYECTEQTVSSFLPNILTLKAMRTAGMQDEKLEAELKTRVNSALQRFYNGQNPDGGWGWWGGETSQVLTSAYVVLGLVEAKEADYAVTPQVLQHGLDFLQQQSYELAADKQALASGRLNTLSFVLYVLARADQPNVSQTVQLYDSWQSLALYARAYLAQTLYSIDPQDPRVKELENNLIDSASLSASGAHWQEDTVDYWNWNTNTRTTAIVLDTLIQVDPQNTLNANAVRWLMKNRVDGRWASTQETAWTLMALIDWVLETGDLNASYQYAVGLNDRRLTEGRVTRETLEQTQNLSVQVKDLLTDSVNRLVIGRDDGDGNLYYSANLNVYLPVPQVKALDRGMILSRRYYSEADSKTPITQAKQGDLVQVRLTIVVPDDMHYLLVEDPLPAGLEALDTSLKTVSKQGAPEKYDWLNMTTQGWGWWYFGHIELRDEKVVLSAEYLPAGTYVYTYLARASTVGTFQVIPPTGHEFYFPDVYGRGDGSTFTVTPSRE